MTKSLLKEGTYNITYPYDPRKVARTGQVIRRKGKTFLTWTARFKNDLLDGPWSGEVRIDEGDLIMVAATCSWNGETITADHQFVRQPDGSWKAHFNYTYHDDDGNFVIDSGWELWSDWEEADEEADDE